MNKCKVTAEIELELLKKMYDDEVERHNKLIEWINEKIAERKKILDDSTGSDDSE